MSKEKVIVYCDGACSGNQFEKNRGGWGAVLKFKDIRQRELYGGEKNTTNNRMELVACIKALEALKRYDLDIEIYSDSAYIVNCIHQKWYVKWQKNGWKTSHKKPVENKDLWIRLLDLVSKFNVKFRKVKGHSKIELNELADKLAKKGVGEVEGISTL